MLRISAIVLPLLLVATSVWARSTSSVTATVTANVVEDLTVTSEDPLNFGFIEPSPQGGTVTVSPDNARTATGGIETSSAFTPATFAVHGNPGHDYTIHTPSSLTFSVRGAEESESLIRELTVTNFTTYSATARTTAATGRLAQDGRDKIYLGATLIVPAGAAPGVYSGWVPLTVSY